MFDYFFYFNRWIFPVSFTFLFIVFIIYKPHLLERIKSIKSKTTRHYFLSILDNFHFYIGNWKKTIVIPIVLAILIEISLMLIFQSPLTAQGEVLWFAAVTSGFLNPVAEEFLTRGIALGMFIVIAYLIKVRNVFRKTIILSGLIIVSYFFTMSHTNLSSLQFTARFSASLLYGGLYLLHRRNLLPPIIAHATWNWYLLVKDLVVS